MSESTPLPLPPAVRSRMVEGVNGLAMHLLEAGRPGDPVVLLLHGFPELAYSWRRVMPDLAAAGYRVIAPDQRGYGRTTGWAASSYEADIAPFRMLNLATDMVALLQALAIDHVEAVVGHDFGSPVAAYAALIRPDLFRRAVLMSAPFPGPPSIAPGRAGSADDLDRALAALDPPRRHYTHYFAGPEADRDMMGAPQGLGPFLRAYNHMKSGDWAANAPRPLPPGAAGLAALPDYYVMARGRTMPETVAAHDPGAPAPWLTEEDLAVYEAEYARTGFQGGLNWYRCVQSPAQMADLRVFSGRRIEVPSVFVAGDRDWGVHQSPGAFEAMQTRACARMAPPRLVAGAGHWVQQEAPEAVVEAILDLLRVPA